MSERSPLYRQWPLVQLLSASRYGVTLREMAEQMGVNPKTIRRDLRAFAELGFPLDVEIGPRGRKTWRIAAPHQPPLCFTFDEAFALYLGRQFLEPLAGTLFWQSAQSAFKKIHSLLNPSALDYLERLAPQVCSTRVGASDYSKKAELIDRLMQAIEDRRVAFLTYQSMQATEPTTYDVHPYGLAYHRGSLYLIGHSVDHDQIRHWKVDRIEEVRVDPYPFPWPDDFDLQSHLRGSFGIYHGQGDVGVTIRFSATVARYVRESRWHESQRLTPQPDGTLLAEFRLTGTEEIKHWILSFGRHAEALSPPSLRQELAGELDAARHHYARPPRRPDKPSPKEPTR